MNIWSRLKPTSPTDYWLLPTAHDGLSDTWLTLLSEHIVNSLLVEPLEQVPHEPGTCASGELRSGRRRIQARS